MTNHPATDSQRTLSVHAILACHNRRPLTVESLRALVQAASDAEVSLSVTVYDDGSTDGTAEAVREMLPAATIIRGDGTAFWAKSMAVAESAILERVDVSQHDLIVWLNDDVVLDSGALSTSLRIHAERPRAVLVGAMRDPGSCEMTYSGMTRAGRHPLRYQAVVSRDVVVDVDTFNGNFVVVSVAVAREIGGIDGEYSHALADIDYGLRCRKRGIDVLLMPGTLGTCPRNESPRGLSIITEWKRFVGPKGGGNPASLSRYLRKSSPASWFVWLPVTYATWWAKNLRRRVGDGGVEAK
ncbi:Glycosyltransferase, GT2 family [Microbacterium testaceum StLB037]|uniref:Glycosyltransferase, GT2 family n=1 Tax=Microbacterium testaceum (strain StLB037) TaxID=979556 RepID=A0A1H0S5D3_MICTS|nr:Glycosyltransferase, GT2 family [Microbacterium testaceum StLB037]